MSKYALNLAADGRILSVTFAQYAAEGAVLVEELPEGNVADYLYQDGSYVHDPLPEPEPAEPSEEDDTAAMLVDHEYRLTLLELGLIE